MPEQAQRRAFEAQAQEKPTDNNHAYEELRHLIVAPEQEGIASIQDRLDNLEKRTEDVSVVVAEAIQMRREKGDDLALAAALAPTIQETLRESVRRDPHVLADALFPVMGPAIRKSIAETLRGMLESFNEALEHSLSWRGMKWRIEAFRTGKPFAEIVMMHSLLYRVEQVFLIHRETGLVLNHVVAPSAPAQDADMVAGLLSAIQQFARDSFQPGTTENLGNMTFDELQIRVVSGPNAVIAAAIRGHAPEAYNLAMNETLEEIQRHYSSALAHFTGDPGPFRAAEADLQFAPYYSLDDAIVARRATVLLHPPAGVKLSAKDGALIPEGSAPQNWIAQLEEKAPWIAGINRLDESHLQNSNLRALNALKNTLESTTLLFPLGRAELQPGQETNLAQAEHAIRDLVAQAAPLRQSVTVELV